MKKLTYWVFMLFDCIAITSCTDDDMPTDKASVRDYQTDAEVLAKFVDVNKTLGEYYINENKKNSPMAYVTNKDWEELMLVSPVNRTKFENELKAVNSAIELAAKRNDVTQIVYNTYNETWVRTIDHNAEVLLKECIPGETTRAASRSFARMQLQYGALNEATFHAGRQIKSKISIDMFGSKAYSFEILCQIDASKTPNGSYPAGGGNNPKSIVMTGVGSMETYDFTWNANSSDAEIFWKFKGSLYTPQGLGECLITAEFTE